MSKKWWQRKAHKKKDRWGEAGGYHDDYGAYSDFTEPITYKTDKDFWSKEWKEYEKTGIWEGYAKFEKSTLDFRYIEQMASALSAKYDIKVEVGSNWAIDLDTKTLTYNPQSLLFGTKAHLLASLLHEIGHLRHTTKFTETKLGKIGSENKVATKNALNAFEDMRIDKIMSNSYGSSKEIFEANKPIVEKLIAEQEEEAKTERRELEQFFDYDKLGGKI